MKKLINNIIYKWPFKVILVTAVVISILAVGINKVSLSTGNETLISDETEAYKDNLVYQTNFGTDPVIIVFENKDKESLLSYESLSVLNDLKNNIKDEDGVFYVNGPISVVDYAGTLSVTKYQTGLNELSLGLSNISSTLSMISLTKKNLDESTLNQAFSNIISGQKNLSTGLETEITLMENMKTAANAELEKLTTKRNSLDETLEAEEYQALTETILLLGNVETLYTNMIDMSSSFSSGAISAKTNLEGILSEINSMFSATSSLETNLNNLRTNLNLMSTNLSTLANNFNGFTSTFPTKESTLNQMVYTDGVNINPMLNTYLIDDTHLFVSIILKEGTTNSELNIILDKINVSLKDTIYEGSLVSGKPVLNLDIKSSMTDSMKTMMITAFLIMILVLLVLFPVKFRLLPLLVVLVAVIGTVGIMGLAGIPLTMVSMAVFPVLIGLGIDYSIQFQSRYVEERIGEETNE